MKYEDFLNEATKSQVNKALDTVEKSIEKGLDNLEKIVGIVEKQLTAQGRAPQIKGQFLKINKLRMDVKNRVGNIKTFADRIE
jgi:uncharacterized protein YoxC